MKEGSSNVVRKCFKIYVFASLTTEHMHLVGLEELSTKKLEVGLAGSASALSKS